MTENRALLKQALIEATIKTTDAICTDGGRVKYSDRHRKRLRSLGISTGISTRAKILIAAIAAALLLTGCAIFHREIAGLFLTFGNGFVNIEGSSSDAPKEIEHAYVATYIPEGFTEVEREEDVFARLTKWESADEQYFILKQSTKSSVSHNIDTEHATPTKIYCNDLCILKFANGGYYFYYWENGGYLFSIESNYDINDITLTDFISGLV